MKIFSSVRTYSSVKGTLISGVEDLHCTIGSLRAGQPRTCEGLRTRKPAEVESTSTMKPTRTESEITSHSTRRLRSLEEDAVMTVFRRAKSKNKPKSVTLCSISFPFYYRTCRPIIFWRFRGRNMSEEGRNVWMGNAMRGRERTVLAFGSCTAFNFV